MDSKKLNFSDVISCEIYSDEHKKNYIFENPHRPHWIVSQATCDQQAIFCAGSRLFSWKIILKL